MITYLPLATPASGWNGLPASLATGRPLSRGWRGGLLVDTMPRTVNLDTIVTLLRDASTTPLAVLARLASTGHGSHYLISLTVDWHAERQSWSEMVEIQVSFDDYLLELHRDLFTYDSPNQERWRDERRSRGL